MEALITIVCKCKHLHQTSISCNAATSCEPRWTKDANLRNGLLKMAMGLKSVLKIVGFHGPRRKNGANGLLGSEGKMERWEVREVEEWRLKTKVAEGAREEQEQRKGRGFGQKVSCEFWRRPGIWAEEMAGRNVWPRLKYNKFVINYIY